jgi:nucleotide-binding universal stress UspA family protein
VVSVSDQGGQAEDTLETARDYLDNLGISAQYIVERGPVAEAILHTSESLGSDFTIMGGYGLSPVLEVVLGSTVDEVLRRSEDPVLICR